MSMAEAGKIDGQSFEYRLQHLPVGVVVLDGDRRVLSANGSAQKLLGVAG
jgi:PAS domain-containing protein